MNRILFVDDEPAVLDGLRNMLRRQRMHWDMVFVASGSAALDELARGSFDIVISDMRMPRMDGAELLQRVRAEHPATMRVVLSGHAERDAVFAALPVAHQFLAKPCEPQRLQHLIERSCRSIALLPRGSLRETIGALDHLPSCTQAREELECALARTEPDLREVAAIVAGDLAMSAKALQLGNSGYFGIGRPITSVGEAVTFLGTDLLRVLMRGAQGTGRLEESVGGCPGLEVLQRQSAQLARAIAGLLAGDELAAQASATALVHGVGEVLLAVGFRDAYTVAAQKAGCSDAPPHVVQARLLGVSHAQAGAFLMGVWGLPERIVDAVAWHHQPERAVPGDCRLTAALHAADALLMHRGDTDAGDVLDHAFLERAGLPLPLHRWRALAAEQRLAVAA